MRGLLAPPRRSPTEKVAWSSRATQARSRITAEHERKRRARQTAAATTREQMMENMDTREEGINDHTNCVDAVQGKDVVIDIDFTTESGGRSKKQTRGVAATESREDAHGGAGESRHAAEEGPTTRADDPRGLEMSERRADTQDGGLNVDERITSSSSSRADGSTTSSGADSDAAAHVDVCPPASVSIPVWRVWPANNKFLCSGRVIIGSDLRGPCLTLSLVLVPSAVYYGVVLKELYPETSFFCLLAVNLLLLLTILASFVRTIAKDPGIVPRRKVPDGMSRSMFGHVPRIWKDPVRPARSPIRLFIPVRHAARHTVMLTVPLRSAISCCCIRPSVLACLRACVRPSVGAFSARPQCLLAVW